MDQDLEQAIDRAGRDRVFAVARANGWQHDGAPKWVWWMIVKSLERPATPEQP